MADSDSVTKKDLAELKSGLTETLTELIREVETNLLTSFHGYGKGQAVRMHVLEVNDAAVNQRLAALEERVPNLETRRPH
jgi:Holliday junction resolvasome RuvABC DNA-binding subunit